MDEIQNRVAAAMQESMAGVPLSPQELAAFTRGLAANYLALMRERNFAHFGQAQQAQMSAAIKAGVNVARILAAIDSAGALTRTLLPQESMMVSFATSIAKMVAAQAQIEANRLSAYPSAIYFPHNRLLNPPLLMFSKSLSSLHRGYS